VVKNFSLQRSAFFFRGGLSFKARADFSAARCRSSSALRTTGPA
jgi:hypothetical protein